LEAEVAELADVVGDLAADVAPPLVVARAEVGAAHGGFSRGCVVLGQFPVMSIFMRSSTGNFVRAVRRTG
jgi:hypothetical protein